MILSQNNIIKYPIIILIFDKNACILYTAYLFKPTKGQKARLPISSVNKPVQYCTVYCIHTCWLFQGGLGRDMNPIRTGGNPLPHPCFLSFTQKIHTWNSLTCHNFWLWMPLWFFFLLRILKYKTVFEFFRISKRSFNKGKIIFGTPWVHYEVFILTYEVLGIKIG